MSAALRIAALPQGATRPPGLDMLGQRVDPHAPVAPPPADAELLAGFRGDEPVARCSLAIAHDLRDAPGASGLIGHYEALEGAAGAALLAHAARTLVDRGVARVLGPIDGDTWHRYRLALPSRPGDPLRDPPPFLGEPRNPPAYIDHFAAAGFAPAAHYESALDTGVAVAPDPGPLPAALADRGITVRDLDPARFDDELRALHALSLSAFAGNRYYAPLGLSAFLALYHPLATLVDPRFVALAEHPDARLAGFLLAFPDPLAPAPDGSRRLVFKTVATDSALRGLGLGAHLFDRVRARARAAGFGAVLHALFEVSNASGRLSRRHGGVLFRRYALYERRR